MKQSINEMILESVQDMHEAGAIDTATLREFDAMKLPPLKEYTPAQIQRLRKKSKTSQGVFAAYLNTSKSTVQQWEQGRKSPRGTSLKLLNLVDRKGLAALG
ncbi:helix-turn-helix domain-containing protein (plasmid) [Microbulbifer sp. ANSA001]|uniref:helix-turn-helix domain-containing protein n=1 Tax=Microbulbifer sp. ANSA001 TaxID=3243358 RepID=UPI0040413628